MITRMCSNLDVVVVRMCAPPATGRRLTPARWAIDWIHQPARVCRCLMQHLHSTLPGENDNSSNTRRPYYSHMPLRHILDRMCIRSQPWHRTGCQDHPGSVAPTRSHQHRTEPCRNVHMLRRRDQFHFLPSRSCLGVQQAVH